MLGLSNDVKVKVVSENGCVHTLSVEYPKDKVLQKIEEAFKSVQNQAKLPGFRPGKAPIAMVKESFRGAAYERAQDILLREGVTEALKSKKLNPVGTPVIKTAEFNPEKAFHFEFEVEVAPTVKLGTYKGLKLNKKSKAVTDEDVKKTLDQILEGNARLIESKAEVLEKNHFAVIDYEGLLDGKPIEGAKTENFLMDMAAPQAIAGLAEGLAGAKVGDSRDVPVTFPADSPAKELAGKQAVFKVKLNAIKEKSMPALDDEFAKDMGLESLEKLKERVRENLVAEQTRITQTDLEKQVVDRLLEEHTFAVPASMIDRQVDHLAQRQTQRLVSQGIPREALKGVMEKAKPELAKQAERDVRLAYLLNNIADAESVDATDAEISARIQEILERSQPNERAGLEKALNGTYRDQLHSELREGKLFSWLIEHAKVKEA